MKKSSIIKFLIVILVIVCSLFPTACKKQPTNPPSPSGQSVSVTLSHSEASLSVGGRLRLTATVTNYAADVVFASSNPSVATVSQHGIIDAVASGVAEITATAGSASAKCVVTVTGEAQKSDDVPVLTLLTGTDTVYVGYEFPLHARLTFQGSDVENATFSYYVSNADRAEIVDDTFKAKAVGKVEIVAYCEYDGEIFFDSCSLEILAEFVTIQVSAPVGEEISLQVGDGGTIAYTLFINGLQQADVSDVSVSSSNESVVTITNDTYQCLAAGKAEVNLSYKGSLLKTIIFIIK